MASAATTRSRKRTIEAQARLRFRPAESKLAQQLRDAGTALEQGTASAHSVAATVSEAITQAIPQITQVTDEQQRLSDALKNAAPGASADNPYSKVAAIDRESSDRALGLFKTNAVADYIAQRARAAQGEAFAVSNLRNQHNLAVDRIGQQAVDLAAQKGDYKAGLAGKYEDKDLQNAFSRAQQARQIAATNAGREDTQRHSDDAAARKEAAAGDKEAEKHARSLRKREAALQKAFVQSVARLGGWTYEKKNPADPNTPFVLPVNKAWVAANRRLVERQLRAASGGKGGTTLSPEMARRVVEAYLRVGSGDPGSFKRYAPAKTVGGAIQQGGTGLPARPFG